MNIKNKTNYLLNKYPLISNQVSTFQIKTILNLLEKQIEDKIEGDIVEFGCYKGTTSIFLQSLIKLNDSSKKLYVYDSFEGLPEKINKDYSRVGEFFVKGSLKSSKKEFIKNFRDLGLEIPIIKKGWFKDIDESQIPKKICFAFLDGDYFNSIIQSFKLIQNSINNNSLIIVDDYLSESLPGTKKATDLWLKNNKGFYLKRVEHNMAIIGGDKGYY